MINFGCLREFAPQSVQFGIGRRNSIRIKARLLDFAVPLITNQIVRGRERKRDQAQDYGDAPKYNRLPANTELRRKVRNCREKSDAGGKCGPDEGHWHLLKRPVVKKIQCGDKANLSNNQDQESNDCSAIHGRAAESVCMASIACAGTASGTATPRRVMR